MGVPPSGSGRRPFGAEPPEVASQAKPLVPNAGALPNVTYVSCPVCYGTRATSFGPCITCAEPDPGRVRWMLERLTAEQIDFLRAFGHTLAEQPVTDAEYRELGRCEFFVEDSDGEFDEDSEDWLIPNSCHWFASTHFVSGPAGNGSFIRYNPAGLLLRECLMCGASASVPHMYPPRPCDSGSEAKPENAERSGAVEPERSQSGDGQKPAHRPTPSPIDIGGEEG